MSRQESYFAYLFGVREPGFYGAIVSLLVSHLLILKYEKSEKSGTCTGVNQNIWCKENFVGNPKKLTPKSPICFVIYNTEVKL